ncbi:MAG TPA: glycosyltransferase family 87 protein [Blastocatellia bacterium]|nr:glycosyltransferase family 87 protein [Blastocatellia bacterium]
MSDKSETIAGSETRSRWTPRRVSLMLLVVVATVLIGFAFTRNLIDFPVYYAAGQSLLQGRTDLYSPDFARGPVMDYRYPPLFLVALLPLWMLPYSIAAYLWYLASIVEIAGCVWVVSRLVDGTGSRLKILIISTLIVAQYFVMILHYGNAHLLAVFLMFASVYMIFTERNFAAALLMSLSITIKLVPILLLPYFALKRKWSFLAMVGLLLVGLNLAPAAYFGFERNIDLLKSWALHVVAEPEFHEANGPIDLSLKGGLRRYFSQVDYSQRIDGDLRYPSVNLVALSSNRVAQIWMALAGISFVSGLVVIWRRSRNTRNAATRQPPRVKDDGDPDSGRNFGLQPLEVGLMICLMLLVGPLTSKIYFIALLWPVVCLAGFAFANDSAAARFGRWALVVVAVTNSVLPLLPGRSTQRLLLVLGVDLFVNVLLTLAVGFVLLSSNLIPGSRSGAQRREVLSGARTS